MRNDFQGCGIRHHQGTRDCPCSRNPEEEEEHVEEETEKQYVEYQEGKTKTFILTKHAG